MSKNTVIGTFKGECADANITNENGLDITRPVWEKVFSSDIYHQAIENGWYMGYLGHPDDPNCMHFQDACIVMTEGHIDDDGKIYGSFNLVDTPVGRVVKTFIDAGVTFGISVRGAGDIVDNSVDPDTFVFRGFDLVSFPAYKEAIPKFTEIAASTDEDKKNKYRKICAAVNTDLDSIDSVEALEIIQSQFPKQSEEYKAIENRKNNIKSSTDIDSNISEEQINGLINLYASTKEELDKTLSELKSVKYAILNSSIENNKKEKVIRRITAAQESKLHIVDNEKAELASMLKDIDNKYKTAVAANSKLKDSLQHEKNSNLSYKRKIDANKEELANKDKIISNLKNELDKTVIEANKQDSKASHLDDKIKSLEAEILASQEIIKDYQDAYADLYSSAIGTHLSNIQVTASTTVKELQDKITGSSNQTGLSDVFVEPQPIDIDDLDNDDENDLVIV